MISVGIGTIATKAAAGLAAAALVTAGAVEVSHDTSSSSRRGHASPAVNEPSLMRRAPPPRPSPRWPTTPASVRHARRARPRRRIRAKPAADKARPRTGRRRPRPPTPAPSRPRSTAAEHAKPVTPGPDAVAERDHRAGLGTERRRHHDLRLRPVVDHRRRRRPPRPIRRTVDDDLDDADDHHNPGDRLARRPADSPADPGTADPSSSPPDTATGPATTPDPSQPQ